MRTLVNGTQRGDYSALPILADALQDAGYDDEVVLAQMRDPETTPIAAERLVCVVLGGPYAESVKAIENIARLMCLDDDPSYHMDYERLICAGDNWLVVTEHVFGLYMHWQNRFEENAYEFWIHYEVITGREIPESDKHDSMFTCSC